MNVTEVVFVAKTDCQNCERIRAFLTRVHHEYRHLDVREVDPDEPEGRSLALKHGILALPAIIINERLRLVGEASEKDIRREVERARGNKH